MTTERGVSRLLPPDPPDRRLDPARVDLKGMEEAGLSALCEELGELPYRGRQLCAWIYGRGECDFERMTDLSREFRAKLAERARVGFFSPGRAEEAPDGTRKYAWELSGGARIESVKIPMPRAEGPVRWALCLSTQAGCAMGCAFCLTGRMGLVRDLSAGEIAEQFLAARRDLPPRERFHNIVFMGMGEPLENFGPSATAARILIHPRAGGVSARRLTVSTVGIAPRLAEFARAVPGVGLAVSLHAADDATRGRLVPVNRKWNLDALLRACRELPIPERRRVTFEYVLLQGVNDSAEDARRLARLLRGVRCKINLLPWNPFPGALFERPSPERVEAFRRELVRAGFTATVRQSKGLPIRAACGQLADDERLAARMNRKLHARSKA